MICALQWCLVIILNGLQADFHTPTPASQSHRNRHGADALIQRVWEPSHRASAENLGPPTTAADHRH